MLTNFGLDRNAEPVTGTDAALGDAFNTGGVKNDVASSDRMIGITEENQQEGEGEEEPIERSPDLSSDISLSPEMAKMEMWMNDRMKQQQERPLRSSRGSTGEKDKNSGLQGGRG